MHTSTHSIPGKKIFCMILRDLADLNVSYFHMGLESLIPGLGRSGERNSYPFQYSGLENSMHHIVQGAAKSWTCLSNFHFTKPLRFGVMYHAVLNYWRSVDDFEDSILWASLVAQLVKNPCAMWET